MVNGGSNAINGKKMTLMVAHNTINDGTVIINSGTNTRNGGRTCGSNNINYNNGKNRWDPVKCFQECMPACLRGEDKVRETEEDPN